MRWRSDRNRNGETRCVKRFAFLRKDLSDGWSVWFEYYWSEERLFINEAPQLKRFNGWKVVNTRIFDG